MKEWKTPKIVLLIISCILLNFFGKLVAEACDLPIWLDGVGTVLCASLIGPLCGAIVGASVNLMYGALSTTAIYYLPTSILMGAIVGFWAKHNKVKTRFRIVSLGMLLAFTCTVISVPINILISQGMTGNLWGDGIIGYASELGLPNIVCFILGELGVEISDKLVVSIWVAVLIKQHDKLVKWKQKAVSTMLLFLVFISLTSKDTVLAADRGVYYDSYIQTIYNNNNGIPGGSVNDIEQTRDGMLWLGTYSGLYQYDGSKFTFMDQFDSVRNVNCLYTDEEGRLWIGTNDNGLSICANSEIVTVLDKEGGLPEDSVRSITKSSDGLYYIGTTGAMCVVRLSDGIEVQTIIDELDYVKNLTASDDGYVCAVTSDGALALLSNSKVVQIIDQNAMGETYTSAHFDAQGYLYVSTSGQKIEKYEVNKNQLRKVATISCNLFKTINSLYMTPEKLLFICADNGVGYLTPSGTVRQINTKGFDSSIDNMLIDYQGNLWFSSSRLGLLKLSESITKEIYERIGIKESVANAAVKWNGWFYFGTDDGLDIVDLEHNRQVENDLTRLFEQVRVRCLVVDRNNKLWIATSGQGVYCVAPGGELKQITSKDGVMSDKTRSILELADGSIAASTDAGISFIKGDKVTSSLGNADGFLTAKTLCLYEKGKTLYAGTDGGGIAVIEGGLVKKLIRKSDGLSSDVILRIVESSDGNGLYIVASNGLNYLDESGEITQLRKFPYYDNFDIIKTADGNMWITCSAGIYIVAEKSLSGVFSLEYELLDSKKGFRTNLTANSWNFLDDDGMLYLCGDNGVISIDTQKYDTQKSSFRIALESVLLDGVRMGVDKEEVNTIARDVSRVEFFPKVINYSVSDPYVQIWLEGFETQPRILLQSELESISYTNLPCGEYTFHLAILDNKQKNVVEEVSYSFLKEKEIYDNWWFKVYLIVILFILTIYFAWLLVGSQIDKNVKIQKKELENLKLKQTADAAVAAGEAKDKFLALMSHDIRTPINAIIGMNEMILRESKEPTIYNYAKDIKAASSTLLSLVNTILDFSKIEEGKMEVIPANYETRDVIMNLIRGISARAQEKGLDFKIDIEETLPCELYGDDVRITQIISNLLTNAVKYTRQGFVSLVIREKERRADSIFLYVEVRDSGIGIRAEDMDKLFESFQRLDEQKNRTIEGTGLGMSIVANLLSLMNSKLDVQSEYGIGSKFSFVLEQRIVSNQPMGDIQAKVQVNEQPQEETHLQLSGAKILVVDDNKMNLKVISGLLKINGVVPDTVSSGMEAIERLEHNFYHIVFLDHMMPDMDGIQTLTKIREEKLAPEETKIIILTANAINGAREQYLAAGFDDYLSKPIEIDVLESKLAKYIPENVIQVTQEEEIVKEDDSKVHAEQNSSPLARLTNMCPQIDVEIGMKYCMNSEEFYLEILTEYVHGNKAEKLEELYQDKNFADYRVLIHSIKSNSMSIGAPALSELAKDLEYAARDQDISFIMSHHDSFMKEYKTLLATLQEYLNE